MIQIIRRTFKGRGGGGEGRGGSLRDPTLPYKWSGPPTYLRVVKHVKDMGYIFGDISRGFVHPFRETEGNKTIEGGHGVLHLLFSGGGCGAI